ncbi:MAG: hypothetical protein R3182_00270, partial [Draconibacterium sp.]|nr:hypothetical protein [Draconibacterium sp.]
NVRLTSRFLNSDKMEFTQHTGFTPQVVDSINWQNQFHLTASTTFPATSKKIVTVMRVDQTEEEPPEKPKAPSTPRNEISIGNIENTSSLDKNLLEAQLLEAEGGIAIRLGNDLILLKDMEAWKVETAGISSTRQMEVRTGHFVKNKFKN